MLQHADITHGQLLPYAGHKIKTRITEEDVRAIRRNVIVLTTGSFDYPLHLEHLRFLKTAASFGDHLLVALNSDENIKHKKGAERPLAPFSIRALTLGLLGYVHSVIQYEGNDNELIGIIKPDVYVQSTLSAEESFSSKHVIFNLVSELGGKVILLPRSTEFNLSTDKIITHIKTGTPLINNI